MESEKRGLALRFGRKRSAGSAPAPRAALALLSATILVAALAASMCARKRPPEPRHLLEINGAARLIGIGGDHRRGLIFDPKATLRLPIGKAGRATLLVAVAAPSPGGNARLEGAVRVTLAVASERGDVAACTIEESLWEMARRWAPCTLHWERSSGKELTLVVRAQARPGGHQARASLALSDPILLPSGWPRDEAVGPVIVVLLDTLRADHLAPYGYARPLGASLAALAKDGILFKAARAPSSWTRTSVATLLTGLSPFSHRVMGREDRLSGDTRSLAQIMRQEGYLTAAWSTNPNVLPLWGFEQGFDRFVDLDAMGWVKKASDARRVFDSARAYLEGAPGRQVFLYLHLNDPHAPYMPPPWALRRLARMPSPALAPDLPPAVDRAQLRGQRDRYDAEILYTDTELGRFLRWLERAGLYRQALIVVVGDHGEEFREHGGIFHGKTLYEEMLRVPLVLKLPGNRGAGSVVEEPVGLEDVAPTVTAAVGLRERVSFEGKRILHRIGTRADRLGATHYATIVLDTARAFSVRAGSHKLILSRGGTEQLFDLAADPGERLDLAATLPGRVRELRRLLEARIAHGTAGWHIKGCGGLAPARLGAVVESTERVARVERIGLEPSDRVLLAPTDTRLEVSYDLRTRVAVTEALGRLRRKQVFDEDEVAFGAGEGKVTVRLVGDKKGAAVCRLGSSPEVERRDRVELSPADPRALDRPSAEHPCPGTAALLWIWYIPKAESVPQEAVDPAVMERLRRLGYIE